MGDRSVAKSLRLMRWVAIALPIISAIYVIVLDPDPLGIGVGFFILFFLYTAIRTKTVGSILLVILGSAFLLTTLYLALTAEEGIDWSGTLNGIGVGVLILAAGILFLISSRASKQNAS